MPDSAHIPPALDLSHSADHVATENEAATPGICLETYNNPASPSLEGTEGYFSSLHPNGTSNDPESHPLSQTQRNRRRRESLSTIRAANPDLSLSGNVISATFNIPHSVKYRSKDGDWELGVRHGQSALFDSLSYLSSEHTPWNHSVVAWTGEIEPIDNNDQGSTGPQTAPVSALSAPVPVDPTLKPTDAPASEGLFISKAAQERLEYKLSHNRTIKTVPVWLSDDEGEDDSGIRLKDQTRWRRYAQEELYTLFHYKQHEPTNGRRERLHWIDYCHMNQRFATKILEIYKPGDVVIIHDYYLMLLPSILRQRMPNMYIAFYLHCPFPSSEFMRCLPRRKEILEGVLGANLVGMQAYSFSRHFTSSCTRILHYPSNNDAIEAFGMRVQVGVFPIGIDVTKVENFAWNNEVEQRYKALKELYAGKKLIVGRDRLDTVRGVAQKLQAFERFLELYPEWQEKVVLIQVTSPTIIESDDPENRTATRVNELVMKINGTYGSLSYSPVQHYPQYLNPSEYFALLRAADIGLITSVRDGMNTTSLEYVVCQRDGCGPLIISEFSGTAGSLRDAIHINPWDLTGVAMEINNALTMGDKQREAMQQSLYNHVATRNVQSWTDALLRRLVHVLAASKNVVATPLLDRTALLRQYISAEKRLFMFDYDGTLTPIVREPSMAVPSERIIQSLKLLASDHRNSVWIISGRDQDFLQQHLGHITELGFSAEHGSFMRHPGSQEWENLAEKYDMGWQSEVYDTFKKYTDMLPGCHIERKRCALTWHYRQAVDQDKALAMSRECQKELESSVGQKWDVEVMPGKANLEVRPTFINKGEIVKRLVKSYTGSEAEGKLEFALCMGDDFTDEDMFRSLNAYAGRQMHESHVFTVTVGASSKMTLAGWHLLEPEDVIECVALLSTAGKQGSEIATIGDVNLAVVSEVEGHIPDVCK
ncbi:hypothetical protein TD95_002300 [Thielaviopsis punctulata]|uniref:Uncharacterized protein n=1 Tax=Thielaviopsis punctulata TaxID=72032 RepID=A0A0F4ZA07_9PEZI|nr:hypothetical protein TD95_002300 [Thielaviopsis punctulata]